MYDDFKRKRIIYGHEVLLPEPPPIREIDNWDKDLDEQLFVPTPFPEDFDDWHVDDQEYFVDKEWDKIDNGYWFFNKYRLEYLSGVHYFYINWWKIKVADTSGPKRMILPSFIDADRDFFLLWDKVDKDPKIGGMVFITNRRDGKSYKSGVIGYLKIFRHPYSQVGIQSMTDGAAQGVLKKVIDAWKHLPYIFRPKDTGDTSPTKSIRFMPPPKKEANKVIKERRTGKEYKNSWMSFKSSESFAYDGEDLIYYILDEAGKKQKNDTNETLKVVLETMVDGATITGKTLVTTTVEEIEGKNEEEGIKGIWKGANVENLNALGRTDNTLIQYFKPSYFGMRGVDDVIKKGVPFINSHGYTDWVRAKEYRELIRASKKGSSLISEIRKYPFNIEEAFSTTQGCYFTEEHINNYITFNKSYVNGDNLRRGNLHWRTDSTSPEVWWKPDPEGKFYTSWLPEKDDRNKWQWVQTEVGRQRSPVPIDIVGGVDPFDHRVTADGRQSDASFHLFRKSGVWDGGEEKDPLRNTFVLEYICRPPTPEEMYDDVLKACVFYGAKLLAENNKSGIINYFRMNGYFDYLMKRPESTHTKFSKQNTVERGIALSGEVPRKKLPDRLMTFVHNDMATNKSGTLDIFMPFNRTLNSWKVFDPNKWTEYDATVSSMLALVASDVQVKLKEKRTPKAPLIMMWDNSGMSSKAIR